MNIPLSYIYIYSYIYIESDSARITDICNDFPPDPQLLSNDTIEV